MITQQDLQEAIAECQGKRNPDASTCIKLAAFLTIQRELYGQEPEAHPVPTYTHSPPPPEPAERSSIVEFDSGSEFSDAIRGRNQAEIWPVMDELMQTLRAIFPRLYVSVMDRLDG